MFSKAFVELAFSLFNVLFFTFFIMNKIIKFLDLQIKVSGICRSFLVVEKVYLVRPSCRNEKQRG